jgi:hypothetical protein
MDGTRRGTLAEATDVIGSQSRQEALGIKHNRYAFARATPCATQIALLSHRDDSERRCSESAANPRLVTKT